MTDADSSEQSRRPWLSGGMPGGIGGWIILYSLMAAAYLLIDWAAGHALRMLVG